MNKILNILLHTDEEDRWAITCKNAETILKMAEIGNYTVNLEIVANSFAVKSLSADSFASTLKLKDTLIALQDKGVNIYCCSESMNFLEIDSSMILPFVKVVPSGVFHIALRQHEGFAYIKP